MKWFKLIKMTICFICSIICIYAIRFVSFAVDQTYDPETPHMIVNQIYGAGKGEWASHSFIELYNPMSTSAELTGWSIQYRSSAADADFSGQWQKLDFPEDTVIPSQTSYLIRCDKNQTVDTGYVVDLSGDDSFDLSWDIRINTKGCAVVLCSSDELIPSDSIVFDNETHQPVRNDFVDLLAASGNDMKKKPEEEIGFCEGSTLAIQSKKKGIRRIHFADTDNNADDMEAVDYSTEDAEAIGSFRPRSISDGAWTDEVEVDRSITFSSDSGFYEDEFSLTLSLNTEGTIYYTLDGNTPVVGSENTFEYNSPIVIKDASENDNTNSMRTDVSAGFLVDEKGKQLYEFKQPGYKIDKATVLTAKAFFDDGAESEAYTKTYFVGMDGRASIAGLNVISITSEEEDLFGYENGIYVLGKSYDGIRKDLWLFTSANYHQSGKEWERRARMEFFDKSGNKTHSQVGGIRIHGNWSRAFPRKSLNLYAREEYDGNKRFNYDFFGNGYVCKKMTLSNGGNDLWYNHKDYLIFNACKNDDKFVKVDSVPYALFLNGEYWGMYFLQEKIDDKYIEFQYGVDDDNVVIIKNRSVEEGEESDLQLWLDMRDYISSHDMSNSGNFERACELIDMDSFIHYYATEIYVNNRDLHNNNACWRSREIGSGSYEDGKWRWILFDVNVEAVMSNENSDTIKHTVTNDPVFKSLMHNESFRREFADTLSGIGRVYFDPDAISNINDQFESDYGLALEACKDRFFGKERNLSLHSTLNSRKQFFVNRHDKIMAIMNRYLENPDELLKFKTTFNAQGGSEVASQYADKGEKLTAPEDPVREGYVFCGWFKEADCVNAWVFEKHIVPGDQILYAKWEKKKRIEASVSGYTGEYDGAAHGITVSVKKPADGYTVRYGTEEGVYDLEQSPVYTDPGCFTVYYQITADDSYAPMTGSAAVTIQKLNWTKKSISRSARAGSSGTVDLSSLIAPFASVSAGDVAPSRIVDASSVLSGPPSIDTNNKLAFGFKSEAGIAGKSAVLRIPVFGSKQYTDYEIQVRLTVAGSNSGGGGSGGGGGGYTPVPVVPVVNPDPDDPGVNPNPDDPGVNPNPDDPGVNPNPDDPGVNPNPDDPGVNPNPDDPGVNPGTDPVTPGEAPDEDLLEDMGSESDQEQVTDAVVQTGDDGTVTTKLWIGGLNTSYEYTGSAVKPAIHVYDGLKKLTEKKDYKVSYRNNKDAGSATLAVEFIGNYQGTSSIEKTFTIAPADLQTDFTALPAAVMEKKGSGLQKPVPVVLRNSTGKALAKSSYSVKYRRVNSVSGADAGSDAGALLDAVTAAGLYTAVMTPKSGNGNLTGSVTATVQVLPASDRDSDLGNAVLEIDKAAQSMVWTGEALVPVKADGSSAVALKKKDGTVIDPACYEISFRNNVNPGTATIIVSAGSGSGYVGSKKGSFKIVKGKSDESLTFAFADGEDPIVYQKGGVKPALMITDRIAGKDVALKEGTDYTVSYRNNKNATVSLTAEGVPAAVREADRTAKAVITGKGNYRFSRTVSFAILPQNLENLNIVVQDKTESKTRDFWKKPKLTVTDAGGKALASSETAISAYTVDGKPVTQTPKAGTEITITVTPGGKTKNYYGTAQAAYRIITKAQDLSKAKLSHKLPDVTYTGAPVTLRDDDFAGLLYFDHNKSVKLIPNVDFKVVSYANNLKKGTATVTLKGLASTDANGNLSGYGGVKTVRFKIVQKKGTVKGAWVRQADGTYVWK